MKKLKITQVRSVIGRIQKQRTTLKHLGLKKMGRSVIREDSVSLQGMLRTVAHLVKVEEVTDAT